MSNGMRALLVCVAFAAVSPSWAQTSSSSSAPAGDLDSRYYDIRHGFSLCPPAGAERQRMTSASQLVSWVKRDAASGAVAWTLAMQKVTDEKQPLPVKTYATAFLEKLQKSDGFKLDSSAAGKAGGRDSFEFAGESAAGKARFWERQLWVEQKAGNFLIVQISGPLGSKDSLNKIFAAVSGTLEVKDPADFEKILKANLKAGGDLLAQVAAKKNLKVLDTNGPQWFLLSFKGKLLGYTTQYASLTQSGGIQVESKTSLDLQGHRVLTRAMGLTPDLAEESWTETLQVDSAKPDIEEGKFKGGEVSVTVSGPNAGPKPIVAKSKAPPEYLPKALGLFLPRVLPLDKPGVYAFFTFNAMRNMLETRTVTVGSEQKITVGGKEVSAVKVVDQSGLESQPANLYLDKDGNVLRMETAEGLTLEASNEAAVLKSFPKAKE